MTGPVSFPALLRAIGLLWLFLALTVGQLHLLAAWPPVLVQLLIPALGFGLFALVRRLAPISGWVDGYDLRILVLPQALRIVGFYFVVLASEGVLPRAYYQTGLGSLVTGVLALVICLLPLAPARRRSAIVIWNVIGLVDLSLLFVAGLRLSLTAPNALLPFSQLPLSLVPIFLAPLCLSLHLLLLHRTATLS
jgi:hypothetical protein